MTDTTKLLNERQKTHGEYSDHARVTQSILTIMTNEPGWHKLSDIQKESLHMFAHKIGRIMVGDPNINDHWDDIAGYAKLVSDRIGPQPGTVPRYGDDLIPKVYAKEESDHIVRQNQGKIAEIERREREQLWPHNKPWNVWFDSQLIERRAQLQAENAAAPGWGAAVGARGEEIKEIEDELVKRGQSPREIDKRGKE